MSKYSHEILSLIDSSNPPITNDKLEALIPYISKRFSAIRKEFKCKKEPEDKTSILRLVNRILKKVEGKTLKTMGKRGYKLADVADSKEKKPKTKVGSRERSLSKVLARIFNKSFPSCRPPFLNNEKTGRSLEIDCFCKELRLGVELNGKQHYR